LRGGRDTRALAHHFAANMPKPMAPYRPISQTERLPLAMLKAMSAS
jgi:hypothetical protein